MHIFFSYTTTREKSSVFFFSSRRRHTRWPRDWSSDVCSSDLVAARPGADADRRHVEGLGGPSAQLRRDRLQHHREAAGLLQRQRVGEQLVALVAAAADHAAAERV